MHTVIVGAGIAGLITAERLVSIGNRVTILEKYDYAGGRILTSKNGYEIGAGRGHRSHRRLAALIRRFHLHTVAHDPRILWMSRHSGGPPEISYGEELLETMLTELSFLPKQELGRHTIRDLLRSDREPAAYVLEQYPYRAETEVLRADLALESFTNEMGTRKGFFSVIEGLSAIVRGLITALENRGVRFRYNTEVTDVTRYHAEYRVHQYNGDPITCDRVILALHADALRTLPVTRRMRALRFLQTAPLLRIYAKYPNLDWLPPHRVVTDSPLRYIIPISREKGIVMISYTDDRDTAYWTDLRPDLLPGVIHEETKRLFPDAVKPNWVKPYEWTTGCTYWTPGDYIPAVESKRALRPYPVTMPELYCCGESFSLRQAWIEGALEHADELWTLLSGPLATATSGLIHDRR